MIPITIPTIAAAHCCACGELVTIIASVIVVVDIVFSINVLDI